MSEGKEKFMKRAIELAKTGMDQNAGGPFGAVVVKDGQIIGEGFNKVTSENDPTAHAEVVAIRNACRNLDSFQLDGCEIYCSCEPCPMCLSAIYWARASRIYYASSRKDAANIKFDDDFIYSEIGKQADKRIIPMENMLTSEANLVFEKWLEKVDKTAY